MRGAKRGVERFRRRLERQGKMRGVAAKAAGQAQPPSNRVEPSPRFRVEDEPSFGDGVTVRGAEAAPAELVGLRRGAGVDFRRALHADALKTRTLRRQLSAAGLDDVAVTREPTSMEMITPPPLRHAMRHDLNRNRSEGRVAVLVNALRRRQRAHGQPSSTTPPNNGVAWAPNNR
jgi:hypothetical protein